jgi:branched-chain amino acid transport system substrate-binding protein
MLRCALVTAVSGPLAEYGVAGATALHLWADWFNQHNTTGAELTVFDAHPDAAVAVRLAETARPDLLFGPYGSGPTTTAARSTSRLLWNHGGASVPKLVNVVNVLAPADSYFEGVLQLVRHHDRSALSVSVLHGDTGFGRAVANGAVSKAHQLGMRIQRAVSVDRVRDADVLLVAGRFADEVTAARTLLPGRWRAAGFVSAGVDEVLDHVGINREALLGPAQWLPSVAPNPDEGPPVEEFIDAYRRKAGSAPPYPAAQAFAAGLIATRCLRLATTSDDDALVAAARSLDCTTLFGAFRIDPGTGRQIGAHVSTVQWQGGVRRVIWPPEQADSTLRYPLNGWR